jgi:hypothetical protein
MHKHSDGFEQATEFIHCYISTGAETVCRNRYSRSGIIAPEPFPVDDQLIFRATPLRQIVNNKSLD